MKGLWKSYLKPGSAHPKISIVMPIEPANASKIKLQWRWTKLLFKPFSYFQTMKIIENSFASITYAIFLSTWWLWYVNTTSKTIAIQILFTYIQTYYRQYIKWVIVIQSNGKTWFVKKKLQLENGFHSVSCALRSQICIGFYLIDIFLVFVLTFESSHRNIALLCTEFIYVYTA